MRFNDEGNYTVTIVGSLIVGARIEFLNSSASYKIVASSSPVMILRPDGTGHPNIRILPHSSLTLVCDGTNWITTGFTLKPSGMDQRWEQMLSPSFDVQYQNDTTVPMIVSVTITITVMDVQQTWSLQVFPTALGIGQEVAKFSTGTVFVDPGRCSTLTTIVPPGYYYEIVSAIPANRIQGSISIVELR